jgi:hypothetical protein
MVVLVSRSLVPAEKIAAFGSAYAERIPLQELPQAAIF